MKNLLALILVTFATGATIFYSCKKENVQRQNVVTVDKPPIANAGKDTAITLPVDSVILDGSASNDPDGSIMVWKWKEISGPSYYILVNANTDITIVKNLTEGVYQFELSITDNGGLLSKDTVQITVNSSPNTSPQVTNCVSGRPEINAQLIPIGTLPGNRSYMAVASAGNKIIFAGGFEGNAYSSTAHIYDISSNTWSVAQLSSRRTELTAIGNGNKIFFAGGGWYMESVSDVDIYDASTNTWSHAWLSQPKANVCAASVGNKVMFAGGYKYSDMGDESSIEDGIDIYDLSTGTWSVAHLSEAREGIFAITVGNKVFFAGGDNGSSDPSNKIDIYDNSTNSWSTSSLSLLNGPVRGVALNDKIYWAKSDTCAIEIRNTTTGTSSGASLSSSNGKQVNVVLKDGKIVFIHENSNRFDIYDPVNDSWSIGVLPQPIPTGAAIISVNNIIYVAGGQVDCTPNPGGGCNSINTNQVWKLEF